jgi:hypothetical protein
VVEGTTFLEDAVINSTVRFVQGNLKQGLYLNGATFDTTQGCKQWTKKEDNIAATELGGPSCGLYAPSAEIGGLFLFEKVKKISNAGANPNPNSSANPDPNSKPNPFWLFLQGSKVTTIEDDEASWGALDHFDVTGCEFETFRKLSDAQTRWRLRWLDRQYAGINKKPGCPDLVLPFLRLGRWLKIKSAGNCLDEAVRQFKPQPYIQLSKVFRAAGYEAAARDALVRLERNKTRYSDIGFLAQAGRYTLDVFLRYGYAPFRPMRIIIAWAVVCSVLFWTCPGFVER